MISAKKSRFFQYVNGINIYIYKRFKNIKWNEIKKI